MGNAPGFWRQVLWHLQGRPDLDMAQSSSRADESWGGESTRPEPIKDGFSIRPEDIAQLTLKCPQCETRVGLEIQSSMLPVSISVVHSETLHRVKIVP